MPSLAMDEDVLCLYPTYDNIFGIGNDKNVVTALPTEYLSDTTDIFRIYAEFLKKQKLSIICLTNFYHSTASQTSHFQIQNL